MCRRKEEGHTCCHDQRAVRNHLWIWQQVRPARHEPRLPEHPAQHGHDERGVDRRLRSGDARELLIALPQVRHWYSVAPWQAQTSTCQRELAPAHDQHRDGEGQAQEHPRAPRDGRRLQLVVDPGERDVRAGASDGRSAADAAAVGNSQHNTSEVTLERLVVGARRFSLVYALLPSLLRLPHRACKGRGQGAHHRRRGGVGHEHGEHGGDRHEASQHHSRVTGQGRDELQCEASVPVHFLQGNAEQVAPQQQEDDVRKVHPRNHLAPHNAKGGKECHWQQ
mmetsp:Transcript_72128/g.227965  ORF Transcript_72128/g.227965 Transcript_72128/m.227965 type:complete len:280 (-) Transcript_72128:253-1092(-)